MLNGAHRLESLLNSIDVPVDHLIIVWNILRSSMGIKWAQAVKDTIDNKVLAFPAHRITIHIVDGNMGCAAAWNFISSHQPAPFTFITSNDIVFSKGYLATLLSTIVNSPERYFFLPWIGYNFFALRPRVFELVGTFDENIWPAYVEDCEFQNRLLLAGWPEDQRLPGRETIDFEHKETSSTIDENVAFAELMKAASKMNWEYTTAKWNLLVCGAKPGSKDHKDAFRTPFNIPDKNLSFWEFNLQERRRRTRLFM